MDFPLYSVPAGQEFRPGGFFRLLFRNSTLTTGCYEMHEGSWWSRQYSYDRYGNRRVSSSTGLAYTDSREPTQTSHFSSTTNRLTMTGMDYDNAGNLNQYGSYTLGYDAESRNTTVTSSMNGSGTFLYDGEGRRVKKTWSQGGITQTTWYFYNALGQLAAEYSDQPPTSTGTSWLFTDMLGSVRAITNGFARDFPAPCLS
jgi:hypothetical protein